MLNQELTYNLPIDSKGKLKYLCTLMRLNQNLLTQIPEEQACQLLSGIVLYHHLPRGVERERVIQSIPKLVSGKPAFMR